MRTMHMGGWAQHLHESRFALSLEHLVHSELFWPVAGFVAFLLALIALLAIGDGVDHQVLPYMYEPYGF